jgi:MoxR-like ATPase
MSNEMPAAANQQTSTFAYKPIFDPGKPAQGEYGCLGTISPYGRPKKAIPYVYHLPEIALAVNVALATRRPLLLSGRPGTGKSTLARDVASCLAWEYLEETITSRTQANDLLWKFDALERLSDASTPEVRVRKEAYYVEPGVLWWTFDPVSASKASRRSAEKKQAAALTTIRGVVVLLDEVDKAEPDVPNDLLVPLGSGEFNPRGHDHPIVAQKQYLLCITTNGERELPQAFVRRCVTLSLKRPTDSQLRNIAARHHPSVTPDSPLLDQVLSTFNKLEGEMIRLHRRPPSTAEFLDAVDACLALEPSDVAELALFTMKKIVDVQERDE